MKGNLIAVTCLALSEEVISDAEVNGEMIYVCEALVEQSHPVNKKVNFFSDDTVKKLFADGKATKEQLIHYIENKAQNAVTEPINFSALKQ